MAVLINISLTGCIFAGRAESPETAGPVTITVTQAGDTAASLSAGSTSPQTVPAASETETSAWFTYDPYRVPAYIKDFLGDSYDDFLAVLHALQNGDETVTLTTVDTSAEFENFRRAVQVFFVQKDLLYDFEYHEGTGPFSFDETTKEFAIKYAYPRTEYLEKLAAFSDLIESIFNENVSDITDGVSTAAELYLYVVGSTSYDYNMNDTVYDAFMQHLAYCQTYSQKYQYLLWQAGIECFLAGGTAVLSDGTVFGDHEWNIVRLDGALYHMDTTWDTGDLYYFGMDDAKCLETGHGADYLAPCDALLDRYGGEPFACTSSLLNDYWDTFSPGGLSGAA